MKTPVLVLTALSLLPPSFAFAADEPAGLGRSDDVQQILERVRHTVVVGDAGAFATNPGQRWTTRFDIRGALTTPNDGGWSWGLELTEVRFGDTLLELCAEPPTTIDGGRIEFTRNELLEEWYVNDTRGLEHGFDVRARPNGANGLLHLTLAVRGGLEPLVAANGRDVAFQDTSGAAVLRYDGLVVFDANGAKLDARFAATPATLELTVDDSDAQYPLTIDPVAQQAYVKASNTDSGDEFGWVLDVSGDTLVVSAHWEASNATGINGNQLNDTAPQAGAVYVFVRSGNGWSQQAYLKASNTAAVASTINDLFGTDVAIDGDTIVVGAPGEDSDATGVNGDEGDDSAQDAGAAYVFERSGGVWAQTAYLKASNTDAGDEFGTAVDVSGDTIVIGAARERSAFVDMPANNALIGAGAVYVFVRSGGSWIEQDYVKSFDIGGTDEFGGVLALDGDIFIAGCPNEDSPATGVDNWVPWNTATASGAAYVYKRNGADWLLDGYLKASNTDALDGFGVSVAIDGDRAVVGAYGEASSATGINGDQGNNGLVDAGAAYVFERTGGAWLQTAYLKASNTNLGDEFGFSVALIGDRIAVGAPREDSSATGIDGNAANNGALGAGAAYLFEHDGATWSQVAYVKASHTDTADWFGWSVALDGTVLAVGAIREDGNGTGFSGDPANDQATESGAVALYDLDTWRTASGCFGNTAVLTTSSLGLHLGDTMTFVLGNTTVTNGIAFIAYGVDGRDINGCGLPIAGFGEALLGLTPFPTLAASYALTTGIAAFSVFVPNAPHLVGIEVAFQTISLDGSGAVEVSNALVDRIAP